MIIGLQFYENDAGFSFDYQDENGNVWLIEGDDPDGADWIVAYFYVNLPAWFDEVDRGFRAEVDRIFDPAEIPVDETLAKILLDQPVESMSWS